VGRAGRRENPEALQGFHSANLLFVIDEASGVDDIIFEVAGGALSGDNTYLLLTSNPTRVSGYFYSTHTKLRERFHCQTVSCFDSLAGETPNGQVSRQYIEDTKVAYGEGSNIYKIRVLGDWPTSDDDSVIPLDLVEAAITREVEPIPHMPIWGLDVARFGNNRTALAKRRANQLMEPVKSWAKRDTMEIAGLVMHEYESALTEERPSEILVDSIGLGAGVVDRLRELGVPVRGINVGETPSGRGQYTNLKGELWWKTREWFESREVSIPADDRLVSELVSVKYKTTSSGKIVIESKEDWMKRYGGDQSPDEADAFVLTMATGTRRQQVDRYKRAERRWLRRKKTPMTR
jgi:hypothetical protein